MLVTARLLLNFWLHYYITLILCPLSADEISPLSLKTVVGVNLCNENLFTYVDNLTTEIRWFWNFLLQPIFLHQHADCLRNGLIRRQLQIQPLVTAHSPTREVEDGAHGGDQKGHKDHSAQMAERKDQIR